MLKRLDELSTNEIADEFDKAGLVGDYKEAELVIRLTIYLVKAGMDPFTFQFDLVEENKNCKTEYYEVVESAVVSSACLADGLSVESSLLSLPQTRPVLIIGSQQNSIHEECEKTKVKDIDIMNDELGSKSSHQSAGWSGLSPSLLALSADSFLVYSPQVLPVMVGALHFSEAMSAIFSSSGFADGAPA